MRLLRSPGVYRRAILIYMAAIVAPVAALRPGLHTPPRLPIPETFTEADHQELDLKRWDLALESYQKLFASHQRESLALYGIARCFAKLGRHAEASAAGRNLAASYPDETDLSHRPYGIVAAIEAGAALVFHVVITPSRVVLKIASSDAPTMEWYTLGTSAACFWSVMSAGLEKALRFCISNRS